MYDGEILGNIIKEQLNKKTIRIKVPVEMARWIAMITEGTKYITGKQPVLNLEKIKELESINWKCDVQPLFDDFNFKPEYNLSQGITETIQWYRQANWLK